MFMTNGTLQSRTSTTDLLTCFQYCAISILATTVAADHHILLVYQFRRTILGLHDNLIFLSLPL